jgi:hypothetical protein
VWREEPKQAELASLLLREGRAFVQPLAIEEIHSAGDIRKIRLRHLLFCSHFPRFLSILFTPDKLP